MTDTKGLRRCSRCRVWKTESDFYRESARTDGRSTRCKDCSHTSVKEWRKRNRERANQRQQTYRDKLKSEVLSEYGKGKVACVVCGEDSLSCLSLDHIKGEGTQHRKELGKWGTQFYQWLKVNGFPTGYQTLCMNCQFKKRNQNKEV